MSEYYFDKGSHSAYSSPNRPQTSSTPQKMSPFMRKFIQVLMGLFLVGGIVYIVILMRGMPDLTNLEHVNPAQVSQLFSADGKVIKKLYTRNRIWISYNDIPQYAIDAALATEDRKFHQHWGINLMRVPRAVIVNLIKFRFAQGSSTITMQVARNLYQHQIGFDRNINRKFREILAALLIERTYSKQEILEMYLNVSYFGKGAYGLQSAAQRYFDKDARELTIEESAMLVGMLKGPALYNPIKYPERAVRRRNVVLHNMHKCNLISRREFDNYKEIPLSAQKHSQEDVAPYFTEHIRRQLNKLQKSLGVNIYRDGLKVYTTLNTAYQAAIDSAIRQQMPVLQEKVNENLAYLKEEKGWDDSTFAKKVKVQIAFVALDHRNGHIKAMVGGRDFDESKFNRVIQAKRQPGSTFKPFLYAAAIDNGYTTIDEFLNQPITLQNADGTRWTPKNYSGKFGGVVRLREALRRSLNIISARLILEVGPKAVVEYAKRLGIKSKLNAVPSLAMGSSVVDPMEMVSAYGVFANEGIRVEPISIIRIEDRHGSVIYEKKTHSQEALSRSTAYIITNLLEDNVKNGTGRRSRWKYNFMAPAAGKTGTTNESTDAWFVGYTPKLTAGVWVGLDSPELKLGSDQSAVTAALPFWAIFMKRLHDDLRLPHQPFQQPPGIITLDICDDNGKIVTGSCFCKKILKNEVFKEDFRPTEECDGSENSQSRKGKKKHRIIF